MAKQISIHEAKRKRFTRHGAGVFTCQCCKRQTRETNGDHAQTGNCEHCFELAGFENSMSDYGAEDSIPRYAAEVAERLAKLAKLGGDLSVWVDVAASYEVPMPTVKTKKEKGFGPKNYPVDSRMVETKEKKVKVEAPEPPAYVGDPLDTVRYQIATSAQRLSRACARKDKAKMKTEFEILERQVAEIKKLIG